MTDGKRQLFEKQKELLDTFLSHGAISRAQYEESLGNLKQKMGIGSETRKAYFAGGCFWCVTPAFYALPGVRKVVSGFSGGCEEAPSYEDVKAQKTGHRETVEVEYDPAETPYEELLDVYLKDVDPFDGGGQFIDRGRSYTLAIYYTDEREKEQADRGVKALEARFGQEAAIALEPFKSFYPAGEEHQDWYKKHPAEFEEEMRVSGRRDAGI